MKTRRSAEDYLETILILGKNGQSVRAVDIAEELEYAKPSVSVALKNLRAAGHVTVDGDGFITLTETGRAVAETMYERHTLISDWLIFLGVEPGTAVADACRMEHDVSAASFAAIKRHVEEWKAEVYKRK